VVFFAIVNLTQFQKMAVDP